MELTRRPRQAIAAGLAAQISGSLPIAMIGATAPELQAEFSFGDSRLGVIAALYFVSGALLGPYGGRLIDRLGPAFGLRATGVIVIACLLVTASAPSFPILLVGTLIGATSMALATSASNVVLLHHVSEKQRGFAFGLKQAAVPLAAMVSGLALPLIALRAGWRWAFFVMVVFPLASLLLAPTTPVEHRPRGEQPTPRARPPRALYLLAAVGLFAATAVGTLSPFLVRAAIEAGFSTGSAGLLLSFAAGTLVVSRVFWGIVIDRTGANPVWVICGLLAVGTLGYSLLAAGTVAPFAIGAVIAYAFGWAWPGVQFLAGIRVWAGNPGEATGVLQTGAFIGATIGPLIFGFMVEHVGFSTGYACSAGTAAVAAGIAAWIARSTRTGESAGRPAGSVSN